MAATAFYRHFDRHGHGEGLKGASTHYCPGCGHGLLHKYLAEAIAELGIQDRTVAVSPVGCSVFLYYYLDVGNTQAAHGRAPAVALGHKLANPNSIVISYQGDGDLASIGLAEIIHAAQLGIPISVIFVNNAIYGMTGGQMAPTTLLGQRSTTTPLGRGNMQGAPLKVSEIIAKLDGSAYVERTALFDHRARRRTKKAIRKILSLQMEGRGFGLVEVLSECPTHLKLNPVEAEEWVREKMVPVFPLGVFKDEEREPWFHPERPEFAPRKMVEQIQATSGAPQRYCRGFPAHLDPTDVSLKFAGAGGDGAQTAALLTTRTAIIEGFDATHIPSYGPESRGGTSYADVHIAREEVLSPASPEPRILVAFNAPSLNKFGPSVLENGIVIYDSSVITETPHFRQGVRVHPVPFADIAKSLGKVIVKNMVALGALQEAAQLLTENSFLAAIRHNLRGKHAMIAINEDAFRQGSRSVHESSARISS